jgi:hypothetical protein
LNTPCFFIYSCVYGIDTYLSFKTQGQGLLSCKTLRLGELSIFWSQVFLDAYQPLIDEDSDCWKPPAVSSMVSAVCLLFLPTPYLAQCLAQSYMSGVNEHARNEG